MALVVRCGSIKHAFLLARMVVITHNEVHEELYFTAGPVGTAGLVGTTGAAEPLPPEPLPPLTPPLGTKSPWLLLQMGEVLLRSFSWRMKEQDDVAGDQNVTIVTRVVRESLLGSEQVGDAKLSAQSKAPWSIQEECAT